MEKPNSLTTAWYESLVPADTRAVRGQMFGHPCAYVNGNMFLGTFGQSVVIRVGAERAATLVTDTVRLFEPMEGRPWKEYVQVAADVLPDAEVVALAREALEHTARLPTKAEKKAAAAPKKAAAPKATPAPKKAAAPK